VIERWEFVDYLLLYCVVACVLWSAFFCCFGFSWVMPRRLVDCMLVGGLVHLECCCVEDGAFLSLVVSLERT
jgi:hydrogenase/urease accessory protein HupE